MNGWRAREDIELLLHRRRQAARHGGAPQRLLNGADLVFLCLPDAAAVEAVALMENPDAKVIDASTAHRAAPGLGLRLPGAVRPPTGPPSAGARCVANPGCHATGFISIVYPLVQAGLICPRTRISVLLLPHRLLRRREEDDRPVRRRRRRQTAFASPGIYGLTQSPQAPAGDAEASAA